MIYDQICKASRYANTNKNIKTALDFIMEHQNDEKLEDGRYELVPDEVIIHVLSKNTVPADEAEMEIHKKYMDIHYMIEGSERCGITPMTPELERMIPYDPETDNGFFQCDNTFEVTVNPGEFYAVWPMEPHRPLCNAAGKSIPVRKMICKVNVD